MVIPCCRCICWCIVAIVESICDCFQTMKHECGVRCTRSTKELPRPLLVSKKVSQRCMIRSNAFGTIFRDSKYRVASTQCCPNLRDFQLKKLREVINGKRLSKVHQVLYGVSKFSNNRASDKTWL